MPPILVIAAIVFGFFQEFWLLIKKPQYRSLVFWVVMVLIAGTIFYNRVEGWGVVDSLYFSVVTLGTVGLW